MASAEPRATPSCHVLAVPYPGRGHVNPMLDICRALACRSDVLITVVVTEEWLGLIGSAAGEPPAIRFATIPNVVPSERVRGDDIQGFYQAVLTKMAEPFERLLDGLPPPSVIIADAFLPWATEVASRRNIPVAHLWAMSAAVYAVFYHFDLLVQNGHFPVELSDENAIVDYIPGLSRIRVADLPTVIRDQEITSLFIKLLPQESKSNYLIFNSLYGLESAVLNALKQKSSFSIYNIGPFTSHSRLESITNSSNYDKENANHLIQWLDLQPQCSVLYVSLGSFLSVSSAQMDEIAAGLCSSGITFLWVANRRTAQLQAACVDKGRVVPWCDQLRVLCHPSVGEFWSHCGWNSTKEAVLAGKPMLASPILMDQLPNAKAVVEDWRIGWRVLEGVFGDEILVTRDEICDVVRRFMELESLERKDMEGNVRKLKSICGQEFATGQAFETNLDGFVESIKKNLQH